MQNKQTENNKNHRIRLSIDIRSIKDHQFLAQIYVKYPQLQQLGIKPFRNSPTLQINNPKQEKSFPNAFSSYYFDANGLNLQQKLNKNLQIQVWHSDRLQKDSLLGVTLVKLSQCINMPLRKTNQSYARVYDAYLPLDEISEDRKPIKKIGSLRIIVYLEDLGPVNLLKQKQQKLGLKGIDQQYQIRNFNPPVLPSENPIYNQGLAIDERSKQTQLNELEYKVVWQLQNWKKSQQTKTKFYLKQKQIQFLAGLAEQQKKQDLEKQKFFKKIQANLNLLQNKLKSKTAQLQKRQQKLILAQQQLQTKITQVSRQLLSKDEQLQNLRKKNKEQKSAWLKQKANFEIQIQKYKNQIIKLKIDLQESTKQDQKSPIFLIKTQLNNKYTQIKQLTRQLQKAIEAKDQYKVYYQKMRNQVVRLKSENQKKNQNFQSIKYENQALKANVKLLQQQQTLQLQQQRQQQQQQYQMPNIRKNDRQYEQRQFSSQLQRLKFQRQQMLDMGIYSPNQPLIKQYDKLIDSL